MVDIRRKGELAIKLQDAKGNFFEKSGTILVRELREGGEFYRLKIENGTISTELPPGVYRYQAIVEGHNVSTGVVKISPGSSNQLGVALNPKGGVEGRVRRSLEYKLKDFGVNLGAKKSYTIRSGQVVHLPGSTPEEKVYSLRLKTLEDFRTILGDPDAIHSHSEPIYGPIAKSRQILQFENQLRTGSIDEREYRMTLRNLVRDPSMKDSLSNRTLLGQYAREYIYGNANAVERYAPLLNEAFQAQFPNGVSVSALVLGDIIVEGGGRLVFDAPTNVCQIDNLRMHRDGVVEAVGGIFEIGTYEEYV